jgi:outer membrane immunogenic protein
LATTSAVASAADVIPRPHAVPLAGSPAAFVAPIIGPWSGFYLGINAGGAWGGSQWNGVDRFDLWGGLIGGTIGYNWQPQPRGIVLGVEGDLDWSGVGGSTSGLCSGCETRNHWLATVRGRVGIGFDLFLPYFTAGLAAGDIHTTIPGLPGASSTNAGWTLGGGLEYRITPNVSAKAEYLHVDLGDFNCGLNCGLAPNGNVSFHANVFRTGLNFRFPYW